jgi:hypothetical protein
MNVKKIFQFTVIMLQFLKLQAESDGEEEHTIDGLSFGNVIQSDYAPASSVYGKNRFRWLSREAVAELHNFYGYCDMTAESQNSLKMEVIHC